MIKIVYLLLILMLIPVANAETGLLTISAGAANPYTVPFTFSGGTYSFDKIEFYSAGYNKVASIDYIYAQLDFAKQSNTTQFTFVSGATGSGGTVTYYTDLSGNKHITWYFADDILITASEIVLSYNTNIFSGVGCGLCQYEAASTLSATQPAYIRADSGGQTNRRATGAYVVQSSTLFSNAYNVTYSAVSQGTLATVFIDKSISTIVNSNVTIRNSTSTKFTETSYNKNNYTYSFLYDTGIALNMTDVSGNYDFLVVNSTAYVGPGLPTPTPIPPSIPPGQQAAIAFNQETYNIGGIGTVTTNINFGLFDINSYRVKFYSTQDPLISEFAIDKSKSSQTFTVQFPAEDIYTASVIKTVPLLGEDTLANDTAQAVKGSASIQVPLTVAVGKNFTVYYTYNYQPNLIEMCGLGGNGLFAVYQADGSIKSQNYLFNQTQGTNYSINISVPVPGSYILQIRDCSQGTVGVSIPFNAVVMSVVPQFNISTSYVTLDQDTYYSGDVITGQYGVDNFNYSNYVIYYELDNITNGVILKNPLSAQKGVISQITDGYDLINLMLVTGMIPNGLNKVALRASNGSSDFEIASDTFNFSTVTASGYDISVDKTCVNSGEPVKIHVVVPAGASAELAVIRASDNSKVTYAVRNTTTISYYPTKTDNYVAMIKDGIGSAGNVQKSTVFSMALNCVGGAPGKVTPTVTTVSLTQRTSDITSLLSSNIFWALMFIIGFMLAIAVYERKGK